MKNLERRIIAGHGVPLRGDAIDTDQIMPARYMTDITFDKMGEHLFYDARHHKTDSLKKHPLNEPKYDSATIMVVQKNFGCGSSREHAPQSILRAGFKAIIGESFAEIFAGNCKALGIPTVCLSNTNIDNILTLVESTPNMELIIDLENKKLIIDNQELDIDIQDERQKAFLKGTWDELAILKENEQKINNTIKNLPYFNGFK